MAGPRSHQLPEYGLLCHAPAISFSIARCNKSSKVFPVKFASLDFQVPVNERPCCVRAVQLPRHSAADFCAVQVPWITDCVASTYKDQEPWAEFGLCGMTVAAQVPRRT